jgi:DNA mismatch endonuclease (patch repair protein)
VRRSRRTTVGSVQQSLLLDPATSARLGRIRQKDTSAERAVRSLLHALGLRFRTRNRDLPGAPDIANRTWRWAVFVHGCFWHAHSGCPRATVPKRNREFWIAKFADNRARDARVVRALRGRGYRTLVVWECEVARPPALARRLRRLLPSRGTARYSSQTQRG